MRVYFHIISLYCLQTVNNNNPLCCKDSTQRLMQVTAERRQKTTMEDYEEIIHVQANLVTKSQGQRRVHRVVG